MKILTYFHVLWTSTQDKSFSSRAKGRNIVGWYMLRSLAHAVACCLGVAAQSLKPVKLLSKQLPTFLLILDRRHACMHVHHAFWYISVPSPHDNDVKMPNFTVYGESKQGTTNFSFWLFLNLSAAPKGNSSTFDILSEFNKRDKV